MLRIAFYKERFEALYTEKEIKIRTLATRADLVSKDSVTGKVVSDPADIEKLLRESDRLTSPERPHSTSGSHIFTDFLSDLSAPSEFPLTVVQDEQLLDTDQVQSLHQQLSEGMEEALSKYMALFGDVFELQVRHLMEDIDHMVHRYSDRVIEYLGGASVDLILDKDMHKLWMIMVYSTTFTEIILTVYMVGRAALKQSTSLLPYEITSLPSLRNGSTRVVKYHLKPGRCTIWIFTTFVPYSKQLTMIRLVSSPSRRSISSRAVDQLISGKFL